MKYLWIVVLVLSAVAVAAPKPQDDAYWWASLSPQYKLGYVYGYLSGAEQGSSQGPPESPRVV